MARRVAAAVGLALVAAGCAEPAPPTLAIETVFDGLSVSVWPADPALITEVVCPDIDADLIAQSTRCSALLHGDELTIDIVVDESGKTTVTVEELLFDVAAVAEELRERLRTDLGSAAETIVLTCDPMVVVARADTVVVCDADRDGDLIGFEVRLLDDIGNWELTATN